MKNFIPAIRTDRYREMKIYEDREYSFINKRSYRMRDEIETMQEKYVFKFGVEVTQSDIYFYLNDNSANIYLSIIEIYDILLYISYREGVDFVVNILKRQLNVKIKIKKPNNSEKKGEIINQEKFIYRGIEYNIRKTVALPKTGKIEIPDSSLIISYEHLFMLINLIQEKSNALFLRGKSSKIYADGLIRMYIILLTKKEDVDVLSSIGWKFNGTKDKFIYVMPTKETERNKKKYYLTKSEYKNII